MEAARKTPALLFDLDGTLVDSVYQHVLAWREALEICGIEVAVWRIHRRIGMSGGLFANALLRETGKPVTAEMADQLQRRHAEAYAKQVAKIGPLPGAQQLLAFLSNTRVPWAIATSGGTEFAQGSLGVLQIDPAIPVITRDQVPHAKPDPDLLLAAADRLQMDIRKSLVIGDSVWDLLAAQRARAFGTGLLSAAKVKMNSNLREPTVSTKTPYDPLQHLNELGIRVSG